MSGRIDIMRFDDLLKIIRDEVHETPRARDMAMDEIRRREGFFRGSIEGALSQVESDERLSYPTATVVINAPLALIQCGLEHQRRILKEVLKALDLKEGRK